MRALLFQTKNCWSCETCLVIKFSSVVLSIKLSKGLWRVSRVSTFRYLRTISAHTLRSASAAGSAKRRKTTLRDAGGGCGAGAGVTVVHWRQ